MARKVSPGEKIIPHMTASWFNSTLNKPQVPKPPRPTDLRLHNEDHAVFVPSIDNPTADRFTPVAPLDKIDSDYPQEIVRAATVDVDSLTRENWVVTQQDVAEGYADTTVVYFGLTYAKVDIADSDHLYVDLDTSTLELVSSNSGKGLILIPGGTYSLIAIGVLPVTAWIGRTTSSISARSSLQLGSGTVDLYTTNSTGLMSFSGESLTVYNTQLESIPSGQVVQMKNWMGLPVVDVGPCTIEDSSS